MVWRVTPTQLRAFVTVVRHGSVKNAAAELGVSEAAVSMHVAQLRGELDDRLFTRTASGLAFTPGGLRLASRATELLGLQTRTILEVSQAAAGRRMLRLAASTLFAEYAAPGLLELFAARADDLDVELSVAPPDRFVALLESRAVDMTVGPRPVPMADTVVATPFLNYQVAVVAAPDHPLAGATPRLDQLRDQVWLLGPSAAGPHGVVPELLRHVGVPEAHERIFQNHAAALEEAKRGTGLAVAALFAVRADLAKGHLVTITTPGARAEGVWSATTLAGGQAPGPAAELARFITTPRATQAMLRGAGVTIGRFRPSVHVTLWS